MSHIKIENQIIADRMRKTIQKDREFEKTFEKNRANDTLQPYVTL